MTRGRPRRHARRAQRHQRPWRPAAGSGAITPKDEEDLRFGLELGVDLVALSFVQTPDDVLEARSDCGSRAESRRSADREDRAAAGAGASRRDPGAARRRDGRARRSRSRVPARAVPADSEGDHRAGAGAWSSRRSSRRRCSSRCGRSRGRRAPKSATRPTAVDQGVDAIMLAGETAAGEFPVRAVETLAAIIRDAERAAGAADVERAGTRHRRSRRAASRARPGDVRSRRHAGDDGSGRGHRRGHAGGQDRATALVAAAARAAFSRSRRRTSSRATVWLFWGVTPLVSVDRQSAARSLAPEFEHECRPVADSRRRLHQHQASISAGRTPTSSTFSVWGS